MMGDAEAFTRDFLPLFRAVPPTRPGVCRICHSGPNDRRDGEPWPICASCLPSAATMSASPPVLEYGCSSLVAIKILMAVG